eukprot:scaffold253363_cov30-Tisochrysis_lutea.AAC.2
MQAPTGSSSRVFRQELGEPLAHHPAPDTVESPSTPRPQVSLLRQPGCNAEGVIHLHFTRGKRRSKRSGARANTRDTIELVQPGEGGCRARLPPKEDAAARVGQPSRNRIYRAHG